MKKFDQLVQPTSRRRECPGQKIATGRILALPARCSGPWRSAQELIPPGLRFCGYIHIGVQKPGHRRKRVYNNRHSNQRNKQVAQLECESAIPQKQKESKNKKWIKFSGVTLREAHK